MTSRRDIHDGKIEFVDVSQICSNFDLAEEEIKEFLEEGKSEIPVNEQPAENTESGDLSRLTICLSDDKHEQKE